MKRSLWSRYKSVSAQRMTIRTRLPWSIRVIGLVLGLGIATVVLLWAYDMGRNITGFNPSASQEKIKTLKAQVEMLSKERDALLTAANAADSSLNIERSTLKQLASQAKAFELENVKLKEDLAFFESLLPAATGAAGIAIRRLKVELLAPNQLRYQMLVMQGGKGVTEFNGNVQVSISGIQTGKNVMIALPLNGAVDAVKFKLSFKHYQRIDDVFVIPQGMSVKTIQARILEKGQIRAQQLVSL